MLTIYFVIETRGKFFFFFANCDFIFQSKNPTVRKKKQTLSDTLSPACVAAAQPAIIATAASSPTKKRTGCGRTVSRQKSFEPLCVSLISPDFLRSRRRRGRAEGGGRRKRKKRVQSGWYCWRLRFGLFSLYSSDCLTSHSHWFPHTHWNHEHVCWFERNWCLFIRLVKREFKDSVYEFRIKS